MDAFHVKPDSPASPSPPPPPKKKEKYQRFVRSAFSPSKMWQFNGLNASLFPQGLMTAASAATLPARSTWSAPAPAPAPASALAKCIGIIGARPPCVVFAPSAARLIGTVLTGLTREVPTPSRVWLIGKQLIPSRHGSASAGLR